MLGKETIDSYNQSENRGAQTSHGLNYQKLGKELMSQDEIATMDGGKCILQVRGVRPFFSEKYDITRHPRYKYLSDADKKNYFDVDRYLTALRWKRQRVVSREETFDLYDIDPVNRRAMVGVMTDPSARRRGYALKALESVAEYCRDVPGLHQIAAMIGEDNEASFALFTRAGFRRTATLPGWYHHGKTYIDAIVMQKEL